MNSRYLNQRQDSLHNQLKDLIRVANNIGCYDAADFLQAHLDKGKAKDKTPPTQTPVAPCHECSNKMVQPDLLDPKCDHIAGCKRMSKQEWQKGLVDDLQSNCPIEPSD